MMSQFTCLQRRGTIPKMLDLFEVGYWAVVFFALPAIFLIFWLIFSHAEPAAAQPNDCCKECKICEQAQALTWPPKKGVYLVLLGDAIDGDTFRFFYLVEDVGRLEGLQAPEIKAPGGPEAKAWLQGKMPVKPTLLRIHSREKYGRALTTMYPLEITAGLNSKALPKIPCLHTTINNQMIKAGHAKPWDGRGIRP